MVDGETEENLCLNFGSTFRDLSGLKSKFDSIFRDFTKYIHKPSRHLLALCSALHKQFKNRRRLIERKSEKRREKQKCKIHSWFFPDRFIILWKVECEQWSEPIKKVTENVSGKFGFVKMDTIDRWISKWKCTRMGSNGTLCTIFGAIFTC